MIPLGEWAPDRPNINAGTLELVTNAAPQPGGSWGPVLGAVAVAAQAMSEPARGLTFVQRTDGGYDAYAGSATKLWKYDGVTQAFTDVSGSAYNLPEEHRWTFRLWNTRLIACQAGDAPQYIDIDSGVAFQDLPNAPLARFVSVANDRVVFSNLVGNPDEIQWSDTNDSENYSTGLSGTNEFPDLGPCMGFFAAAGVVLFERGMKRIVPTGDVYSFDFQDMTFNQGTQAPYSCIEWGGQLAFVSENGIYIGNAGAGFRNISNRRITNWFFNNLTGSRIFQIEGAYDPYFSRLYWAWASGDAESNDQILVWDYSAESEIGEGRWANLEVDTMALARFATTAISLEGGSDPESVDAPGMPSFDSAVYQGGRPVLVFVDPDGFLQTFGGDALEATFETCLQELNEGVFTRLQDVQLRMRASEATGVTLEVATFETDQTVDSPSYGTEISLQSGFFPVDEEGRFHKFRFTIPAAARWTHVLGWIPVHVPTSEF